MSKPFAKLNRADLQEAPIWEWVPDDGASASERDADESSVQRTEFAEIPLLPFAQFIVASLVELKHGGTMPGIAEVTVADGNVAIQPTVVFLLDRQLQIPGVETNRLLARYTKTVENYPVAWRLAVSIQGESAQRTGQIKGGDMKDMVRAGIEVLLALKSLRK